MVLISLILFAAYSQALPIQLIAQSGSKGILSNLISNRAGRLRASISYGPVFPTEGQSVQFKDASTGSPTSWLWDFGDGATSTEQNPSHVYIKAGFNKITLIVNTSTGSKKASRTISIMPAPATASFVYSPASPIAGQIVQFADTTSGEPTSWRWEFGDGATSTTKNPSHTYAAPTSYIVTVIASNSSGSKKGSRTVVVLPASSLVASFAYIPASPVAGQAVQFTDTSAGIPTSWQWNFGDGTSTTAQSPSHSYATAGSKTVTLTVTNASGSNSASRTVTVAVALAASFTYSPTSPVVGQAEQFTDTSMGNPTAWQWSFGDGTSSTAQSPSHSYATAGSKTVTLTVTNSSGSNTATRTVTVGTALSASFTYSPTSPVAGQEVQFTDTSMGSPTSWQWNFNDGASSTVQHPSHTFTSPGSYNVTLTVSNSSGSTSSSLIINISPGSTLLADFDVSPSSPTLGQPVQFTDTSTGSPTSWEWEFGDGQTSVMQNPSHTYTAAGSYGVTLTVRAGASSDSATRTISVAADVPGYHVDTANPSASDSNPGTENLPWKTLTKANQTLVAGDTVYLKAGTYTTYIAPARTGTVSGRITYRAYGSDIVTIQNASYGILLDGKSYITVQGINFYNLDRFMYLQNGADHNIIAYCNFDQMRNGSDWSGSRIRGQSSHNWIHHCRFSKYGACTGTPPNGDDSGVVLEIGNEESMTGSSQTPDFSNYNLIENCVMYHGGHHVLGVMGQYNVIRNNYLHNEGWSKGRGNRTLYMNGYAVDTGWNLIESNRFGYSAPPCDGTIVSGVQITSSNNIFRINSFYFNNLAGLEFSASSNYYQDTLYNHVYNNTFFRNSQTSEPDPGNAAVYFAIWDGPLMIKYNVFKNNLYYGHPKAYGDYRVSLGDQTFANEFNGDVSGDPKFVNASAALGDPMDASYPNLQLNAGSPCIDKGGALTTITSSSGSGMSFKVTDAAYFMDGWGIAGVEGDEIQIVGTTQKARITKVEYSTNTITVNTSITWTQNQGIALAYVGSGSDVGAHEYGALPAPVKK
jgi:PKD repeat protein